MSLELKAKLVLKVLLELKAQLVHQELKVLLELKGSQELRAQLVH